MLPLPPRCPPPQPAVSDMANEQHSRNSISESGCPIIPIPQLRVEELEALESDVVVLVR